MAWDARRDGSRSIGKSRDVPLLSGPVAGDGAVLADEPGVGVPCALDRTAG